MSLSRIASAWASRGLCAGALSATLLKAIGSALATAALALLGNCVVATVANADIQYVYDAAGRLVQVTAPSGTSAQYTYDAAGNIIGIQQLSATTLSLIEFAPKGGLAGTAVTLYGTGFSSTPANNTVTFNGTVATVVSAATTQLSVTVPSGATTGTVSVQVGTTTVSTTGSFIVFSGSMAPSISSFTPTIATTGSTVTVSGSQFDPVATRNKLQFNGMLASISSVTSTQIVTKVPIFATSGRFTIKTVEGMGTSSGDMFIPPAGYAASDVGYTGRTTVNSTTTVSTTSTAKIGILLFDGVQGQQLGVGMGNVVYSPSGSAVVYFKKPDGDDLMQSVSLLSGTANSLPPLPVSGTYSVLVIPNGSVGVSAVASVSQDVTGTIAAGGSAVTTGTTYAGQRARLYFSGSATQRVSLRVAGVTLTGGNSLSTTILKPDDTTLATNGFIGSGGGFVDVQVLPVTGTYSILVDPASMAIANTATLTLYNVPADNTGAIAAGGSSVTTSTSVPGQSSNLSFAGTSGHRYSVAATGVSVTGATGNNWANFLILNPDGTTRASVNNVSGSDFMEPQSLPTTGTYTVSFHPINGSTGTGTFALYDVPVDPGGTITASGPAVTVTTTIPGQNANLTFGGTSSQRVSLAVSGVSVVGQTPSNLNTASALLIKPDGNTLISQSGISASGFIDTQSLPTTGTYTVRFDPSGSSYGTATFNLYTVPGDATSSVVINGATTTVTISTPGQNASVTFAGTANQQVTVHVTNNTIGAGSVILKRPDNTTMTFSTSSASSFNLTTQTLPTTGTYTVYIDPSQGRTGSQTINVSSP